MAPRGRKPKPTGLKVLQGNPGHRALPKEEPKPRPMRPTRPHWLQPEAKREWTRVVAELEALELLTVVDRAALAAYCQAYARAVAAEKALDKAIEKEGSMTYRTDSGQIKPRPEIAIALREWQMVRAFAAEFGLTPSSRVRMAVPRGSEKPDPFEEWMASGSRN